MTIPRTITRIIGPDTLHGTHIPGHTNRAIVYVHGLGGHRGGEKSEALARECQKHGLNFVAFDFRGHGTSSGHLRELTATRLLEDLNEVCVYLAEQGFGRFGLVGSSMGGFAAAWLGTQQPDAVAACVLLAPAFRFVERRWHTLTPEEREQWRIRGTRPLKNDWLDTELGYGLVAEHERYTLAELARSYRTPTRIYHGLADTIVPVADSLAFAETTTYPQIELRLWKDGDHRLTAYKDTLATEAVDFLQRHLSVDRG